jgi:hypothetical protein
MGAGPSVTFNVLHVFPHLLIWGRYAVAAAPPLSAVLALAALMQQVLSLPEALRHIHLQESRTDPRTDQAGDQAAPGADEDTDRARLAGRAAIIADLAEQMEFAMTSGGKWEPDYRALMSQTGYRRSWCEKAVQEARTVAFLSALRSPAAVPVNGHALAEN